MAKKTAERTAEKTADVHMAVLVTLVFADEVHREAWLAGNGFIPPNMMSPPDEFSINALVARRLDFNRRRFSQNLIYTVEPVGTKTKIKR